MTLVSATPAAKGAPARRADDKDRVPVEIERDRWGRPLILQPDGTRVGYTRASGLGKVLEDSTAITRWKLRVLAWALPRHDDLRLRALSIAGFDERDDKRELDEIVGLALDRGGAGGKARIGTALHALTELVDQGRPVPDVGMHRFALDAYAAVMGEMFEVLDSEVFVVHDRLRTAGTYDRRVRLKVWMQPCDRAGRPVGDPLPPGTVLVLDLKTSGTADYFGIAFAVQTAVYDEGERYDPATGARTPLETHGRWALILHVPSGGNVAELHWADLERARTLAELAVQVKGERTASKGLISRAAIEPWTEQPASANRATGTAFSPVLAQEPGRSGFVDAAVDPVFCGLVDVPRCAQCGEEASSCVHARPATFAGQIFDTIKSSHDALRLAEEVGRCTSEAALLALYRTNHRIWSDVHTARAGEVSAQLAARAVAS